MPRQMGVVLFETDILHIEYSRFRSIYLWNLIRKSCRYLYGNVVFSLVLYCGLQSRSTGGSLFF